MRLRSTLILAVLFAALAGFLYFVELPRETGRDANEKVLTFDRAAVTHIELEHPGRSVVLQKREGNWQLVEPVEAPADQRNVENLLQAVEDCEIKRTIGESHDLKLYGLDFPAATIEIGSDDGSIGTIKVGKKTPVGGSAYLLRSSDSAVHLTDATFVGRIDQKATDLRDKTVADFDKKAVRSLELRNQHGDVTLAAQDGGWRITAPREYEADSSQVDSLLSSLGSLRAVEFLSDDGTDLERFGLDHPRGTVTLGFQDGEPLELRIGNEREGKLRVQTNRRPTVYAVASWAANAFDKSLADLRDKTVASFAADDAAEIEIEAPGEERIELRKAEDGWKQRDGDEPVAQAAVGALLQELSSLRGFEIAAEAPDELAALGLDPASRSIRVRDGDGTVLAAVEIGSHAADGAEIEYSARAEGSSTVVHLREISFERIDKGSADLFEKPEVASEGTAAPVPNGETGDGVDDDPLDDAATSGEQG